jgi:hypothetical protein
MGCWLLAAVHQQSSCAGALGLVCGLRLAACAAAGCAGCWLLAAGAACGLWPAVDSLSMACCVRLLWLVACGLLVGWLWFSCCCWPGPRPGSGSMYGSMLYTVYRTLDTGCQSSIFDSCCRSGWPARLLAAGCNRCHLPSAICHLQSSWLGLAAVAVAALLLAVVG